ncbi:hypothetical protein HU200_047937 [Digitaria exilis]|uniref:Uncharacterized protein n=1 Tax=Digitaria exilis TaxID=1010633 RepID=A0A835B1J4_9POAL|nr:hypothetical protein HU200_047937 [Digitaria exilis]
MDNVLIDRSASGFDFRSWTDAVDGRSIAAIMTMSTLPPRGRSFHYGSFPDVPPLPPFQYTPYVQSWLSLPPQPPRHHPALLPHPPIMARTANKHAAAIAKPAAPRQRTGLGGEYNKRKKQPRAPRAQRRRKPLERAAALPVATAVDEALDDLEREVTRGFVEDLMDALAPPPSSLPLPTFSLVRAASAAANVKAAAAAAS